MRIVISKNSTTTGDRRSLTLGPRTRSCDCGQQLDVCARAHCPRCGRTVRR